MNYVFVFDSLVSYPALVGKTFKFYIANIFWQFNIFTLYANNISFGFWLKLYQWWIDPERVAIQSTALSFLLTALGSQWIYVMCVLWSSLLFRSQLIFLVLLLGIVWAAVKLGIFPYVFSHCQGWREVGRGCSGWELISRSAPPSVNVT